MAAVSKVDALKAAGIFPEDEYVPTERELEQIFRRMGCSKRVTRTLVARVFKGLEQDVVTTKVEETEALVSVSRFSELLHKLMKKL